MENEELLNAYFGHQTVGDQFPVLYLSRRLAWLDKEIKEVSGDPPILGTPQDMDQWVLDLMDLQSLKNWVTQPLLPLLN